MIGGAFKRGIKAGNSLKQGVLLLTPLKLTDKFRGII